ELARIVVELERVPGGEAAAPRAVSDRSGKPPAVAGGGTGDKPNYEIETPPEAPDRTPWQKPVGWIGVSVAGVALTAGVVSVFTANNNYNKFNQYTKSRTTYNGKCNANA